MGPSTEAEQSRVSEFVSGGNLVLHNGRIHTLEKGLPEVEGVVIRNGRIIFIGSSKDALARADGSRTIDLEARFALPGFIDSHVHFWRSGLIDQMVDLRRARRIADIQDALREKIAFESQGKLLTLMDPRVRADCLDITARQAVEGGVTTVHCLEGGRLIGDPDVKDFIAHQHSLPVSTVLYYQIMDLDRILDLGLPRIGGCVLIDGSPAAHTGALYESYADRPDTIGPEYFSQQELNDWVFPCHRAGLQIAVHATSERAIGQMLAAYQNAPARFPRAGHRHRIDHFYFPRREQVWKAAQLGVLAGVQPYFAEGFREMYLKRLGPERAQRVHPYRWFWDAGAVAGGGSDSFVTPIRPLWGIHAAVNHFIPEQRIGVREAVLMFTRNNAYLGFEEDQAGSLRVGKRGDVVVLSDDLFNVAWETIKNVLVVYTISRGCVTYRG